MQASVSAGFVFFPPPPTSSNVVINEVSNVRSEDLNLCLFNSIFNLALIYNPEDREGGRMMLSEE